MAQDQIQIEVTDETVEQWLMEQTVELNQLKARIDNMIELLRQAMVSRHYTGKISPEIMKKIRQTWGWGS